MLPSGSAPFAGPAGAGCTEESTPTRRFPIPIQSPIAIGRFTVSPLIRRLADRRFAASVSIRSGTGTASHDRVLRLIPTFDNPREALQHAADQGRAWVAEHYQQAGPAPQEA